MVHKLKGYQRERFDYLLVDSERITKAQKVASTFKTHWQNIFKPHPPPTHEPSVTHINNISANTPNMPPHNTTLLTWLNPRHFLNTPVEKDDVSRLVKHTPRRAPSSSSITWPMARNLSPEIIKRLTDVFNASGYFLQIFKISNITLIPKLGKRLSSSWKLPSHKLVGDTR